MTIPYAAKTIQETLFKQIQATGDLMGEITRLPRVLSDDFTSNVQILQAKTKEEIFKELNGEWGG